MISPESRNGATARAGEASALTQDTRASTATSAAVIRVRTVPPMVPGYRTYPRPKPAHPDAAPVRTGAPDAQTPANQARLATAAGIRRGTG